MLRPRFRYSHALVTELLRAERARAMVEFAGSGALPGRHGDAHSVALQRVAPNSAECPTERTLYELRAVLDQERTGYRRGSGLIYNQARTDLIYVPPEAPDVPDLMADVVDWLAETWESVPGVVLAGVFEEEVLLIQPFERNNGALARLAADTVLVRKGYGFANVQAQMGRDPHSYSNASHSTHRGVYSEEADLSGWLEYFAGEVAAAAEAACKRLEGGQMPTPASPAPAGRYVAPTVLRERQIRALKHIRENGAIRSGEYQRLAGIVPDTARRDFDDLIAKGLIEVKGVGRGTHYLLTARGADEAERRRIG